MDKAKIRFTWIISVFDIFEIRFVEQVTEVYFAGQRDSENLKNFIDAF